MSAHNIPGVTTFEFTKIVGVEKIQFGRPVIIDDFVFIYVRNRMKVGNYAHIACFSSIVASEEVEIGDYAAVSHGCRILTGTDDFTGWGFGNSTVEGRYRNLKTGPVRIGRFCIIGANSVVLPGVTIGEGATVGACSVVTRDLAPWGVYLGNRKIRDRDRAGVMANFGKFELEAKG